MKIQVVIEATSIQEYTEAIQALAAGYTVQTPVINVVAGAQESAATVETEETEEKPKTKTRKATGKPAEAPKEEKKVATPKAEEKTEPAKTETPEQSETETKGDEKLQTSKYGFAAVKLQAGKLNKIPDGKADLKFLLEKFGVKKLSELTEDQYDDFHNEVCDAIDAHDNATSSTKEDAPKQDATEDNGEKEATIEMIRGKAKELSVAGYKEDIKGLLKEFGAAALTKIPKDKYSEFYAAMERIG